jgi:Ca-activated chloride channel family protein
MRGKRRGKLGLLLLPAALFGAGVAAAETAPQTTATPPLRTAIVVLDASKSMNDKLGGASKIASARTELGKAVAAYDDRLSFGLVAFGHRKASNCADSEIVAKPDALTGETQSKLLAKIKPKGQAPVAAALSDAAKGANAKSPLDIVLIADGTDTCDADICSAASVMKEKSPALRIHVIGFGDKEEELKPLSCLSGATGGTFVVAANAEALKASLAKVLDAVITPPPSAPQTVATGESGAAPLATAALPAGVAVMPPANPGAGRVLLSSKCKRQRLSLRRRKRRLATVHKSSAPPPAALAPSQSAGASPSTPNAPKPPAQSTAAQIQLPVPVTFKALVSEAGPRLQTGLTWRVYESKALPGGAGYKLLSTHRDPMPTAALLPGEYLVNAAYGLSNLTKKINVETGRSIEETFVLNTGGLKLAALLASGEPLPKARFDILSDEEDQFGNRQVSKYAKTVCQPTPGLSHRSLRRRQCRRQMTTVGPQVTEGDLQTGSTTASW